MPDFLASLLVFSVIITIFLFSWNSVIQNQTQFDEEEEMRSSAYRTTAFLVTTPGYPENWDKKEKEVQIPGFASSENVLDYSKLKSFSNLKYKKQKKSLEAQDFYMKIKNKSTILTISDLRLEYGKSFSDANTVIPVRRQVLVKVPSCLSSKNLFCPLNPQPKASNVVYNLNFEIQSGSPTIGNSLNSLETDIGSGSPKIFQNTGWDQLKTAGVDNDSDGQLEINLKNDKDDWIIKEDGSRLKIEFGGSAYTNPEAGDIINLEFGGVENPQTGKYNLEVQTSGDGNWQDGQIKITEKTPRGEKIPASLTYIVWN